MLQLLDAMQPGVNVRLRLGGVPGRPVSFDTATDVCKEIAAMIDNRYAAFDVCEGNFLIFHPSQIS